MTVSTSYSNKKSMSSANCENSNPKLGLLSAMGKLLIYDLRNTDIAMCESDIGKFIDIGSRTEDANSRPPVMNFSPDDVIEFHCLDLMKMCTYMMYHVLKRLRKYLFMMVM